MERDKLIQKYLHSELTDSEREDFLDLYENDDIENTPVHNINEQKQSKQLFLILRNVAAILILGLTSFYFFNSLSHTESSDNFQVLVDSHIQDRHDPPYTTMNVDNELEDPWKVAYRTKNYSVAIDQLSKIDNPLNEQILYLALCHMYVENPNIDKTVSTLKGLLANKNNVINDEAEWFLSLAYLQKGDISNGKSILEKIVSEKSWNHKKASELLQLIPENK